VGSTPIHQEFVDDREGHGLWVTAFGYQNSAMLASVLEELRPSGGEFMQHRLGVGPWVHVQYRNRRQQQQALARNGKVLHGVMLGVIEGVVPSTEVLHLPAAAASSSLPLKLQHQRPLGTSVRGPAIAQRDLFRATWWTRACEYLFGW
jgi:hypothetical protein